MMVEKSVLERRRDIIYALRRFFYERDFLEVETPAILSSPIPEMNIEPVKCDLGYLITSPELHMKKLLASGYNKIFQICKVFRKGEYGRNHLPEFTIVEWYRAGATYIDIMVDCQDLIRYIGDALELRGGVNFKGRKLVYNEKWNVMTVREAFSRWAGWDPVVNFDEDRFYKDLVELIEPKLGWPTPCIIKDYPASEAALAKLKASDTRVCERFEVYWGGIELANGFSELNDPVEQRERFVRVLHERKRKRLPDLRMPEDFLIALETMPDSAGIALGVDRLVMILCGMESIQDVVLFSEEFRR